MSIPAVRGARGALAAALLAAAAWGCVTLKPVVLDRKTQLENQILGKFQRLEQDLILASSVRGERPEPKMSPLEREAVQAMMTRAFIRDDIEALKLEQVVGEANTGLLKVLAEPEEAGRARQVRELVDEENRSRTIIMKRVVQTSRELGDEDLPLVRRIFHRLNVQTARPGEKIQREGGGWEVVRDASASEPPASPGTRPNPRPGEER